MDFKEEWLIFSIAVSCAGIGFVFYFFLAERLKGLKFLSSPVDPEDNTKFILVKRALGFLILGIIPSILFLILTNKSFKETGFRLNINKDTLLLVLLFAGLFIPVNFFNSRQKQNLALYPEIRKRHWSVGLVIVSALSWIAYLLAYEFLFRGILLFPAVKLMGFWPAILLNTSLYTLVHLPKGIKESLGSIPMGIILCSLAIFTGSFWIAFFIHVILALTNEWYSIRYQKDIHINWSR